MRFFFFFFFVVWELSVHDFLPGVPLSAVAELPLLSTEFACGSQGSIVAPQPREHRMLLEITALEQKCPVLARVKGKGVVIPGLLQLQGLGEASW